MLLLAKDSPEEMFAPIYSAEIGYVFKYVDNYETIIGLVQKYTPPGQEVTTHPVVPGTELYENYGSNSVVLIAKRAVPL